MMIGSERVVWGQKYICMHYGLATRRCRLNKRDKYHFCHRIKESSVPTETRGLGRIIPKASGFSSPSKGFGSTKGKKNVKKSSDCPCGSDRPYKDCCQVYHDGEQIADTAEALMRARYSAYAKGLVQFIVDSTHPENPLADGEAAPAGTTKETLEADVRATCEKIAWEKLKVLATEPGSTDDEAYVTFQTWFKVKGQQGKRAQGWVTQSFVEKSRFLKDNSTGRWLYLDGEQEWKQ